MYLDQIEDYLGVKYPWKSLNLIIPPADYPYSSMENGNMIFISPSVVPLENNLGDDLGH